MQHWKRHLVNQTLADMSQRYGRAELRPGHVLLAKFWRQFPLLGADAFHRRFEVAATLLMLAACWEACTGDNGLYKICRRAFKQHHISLRQAIQSAMSQYPTVR